MSQWYDDIAAQLADIRDERAALDALEYKLVKELRSGPGGYYGQATWDDVAKALGVTRQAAMKRFAQRLADDDPSSWKHRRRWDAGRPRA